MSPRRYALHETEKIIASGCCIPWRSEAHTSESDHEYREAIEVADAVVHWAEEHL